MCGIAVAESFNHWNRKCVRWMSQQYVRCMFGIKLYKPSTNATGGLNRCMIVCIMAYFIVWFSQYFEGFFISGQAMDAYNNTGGNANTSCRIKWSIHARGKSDELFVFLTIKSVKLRSIFANVLVELCNCGLLHWCSYHLQWTSSSCVSSEYSNIRSILESKSYGWCPFYNWISHHGPCWSHCPQFHYWFVPDQTGCFTKSEVN